MDQIDLHMHSTYSDGMFAPLKLVTEANRKGLSAIALTDHDTIDGLDEAKRECGRYGIQFVNGVEINSCWQMDSKKIFIHVLGYQFDPVKI